MVDALGEPHAFLSTEPLHLPLIPSELVAAGKPFLFEDREASFHLLTERPRDPCRASQDAEPDLRVREAEAAVEEAVELRAVPQVGRDRSDQIADDRLGLILAGVDDREEAGVLAHVLGQMGAGNDSRGSAAASSFNSSDEGIAGYAAAIGARLAGY